MSDTYLITGGAGNLASHVSFELRARGKEVILADVALGPAAPVADGCKYVQCDLTVPQMLRRILSEYRPTAILHFAAIMSGQAEQDRRAAWRLNMDATFELFEAALEQGIHRVLFPSSIASYGGPLPNPLPEDFPQWPEGMYGVTKQSVERLGAYYHARHGMDFRALRVPIVLSPYAAPGAASAYVSRAFIDSFHSGRYTFRVRPDTSPAVIYLNDVVQALVNLLEAPAERLTRCIYNIYALSPTASELAEAIRLRLPRAQLDFTPDSNLVRLIESWPSQIIDDSARCEWGWCPRYDLTAAAGDFFTQLAAGASLTQHAILHPV